MQTVYMCVTFCYRNILYLKRASFIQHKNKTVFMKFRSRERRGDESYEILDFFCFCLDCSGLNSSDKSSAA